MKATVKYLFFLLCGACTAQDLPATSSILNSIQTRLSCSGILRQSKGFVYVDVDDEYIHGLVRLIQEEGFEEPPYFDEKGVGAHITVVYPEEMMKWGIKWIEECGMAIQFTPQTCQIVQTHSLEQIDDAYLVVVDAPWLDILREKYGLPKREYPFHITIGVKPKAAVAA